MPWEEELKQLDTDFAEGRIAQDEYRRLRDDLLARASAPVSTPRIAVPAQPPETPETPLRWRADNPGGIPSGGGVPGGGPVSPPRGTPVVTATPAPTAPVWTPPAGTASPSGAATEAGAAEKPEEPAKPETPPVPEELPEMHGTEPPWLAESTGLGFEPVPVRTGASPKGSGAEVSVPSGTARVSAPRPGERLDGAEVFRSARPESSRRALPFLLVIVVLVVLAGGVWLVTGRDDGGSATAGRAVPAGTTTPAPKIPSLSELVARLPELPGTPKPGTGLVDPDAGVQLGFYSAGLTAELHQRGVHQVLLRDTHNGAFNYLLLVVPGGSVAGAGQVTTLVRGYEASVGMGRTTIAGLPDSVYCTTVSVAGQTVVTGLFHSAGYTIWLGVGMVPAGNQAAVSGEFKHIAGSLLAAAKPD